MARTNLLTIPAELRLMIYDHIFADEEPIIRDIDAAKQPTILCVCRALRYESAKTYTDALRKISRKTQQEEEAISRLVLLGESSVGLQSLVGMLRSTVEMLVHRQRNIQTIIARMQAEGMEV